ncbi:mucin-2 [Xenopus laevis]|uniref:Mucin-2 n=1 Tax=Xenopus laevis TaxID=8355 RepID=A0A8J1MVR4_XENLA|nr:mucin-2 [Xenopus laevis]
MSRPHDWLVNPQYSTDCISGCVCPTNMLADGKGGCVTSDQCTCIHNDIIYDHRQSTRIGCSMCTCNNQKWECEQNDVMTECTVYGEGNYITFDGKQYRYNGQCEYTLVQDYCGYNVLNGTFRIISENTKCGTSGTTCSKSITVLINDFRLVLSDGNMQLTNYGDQLDSPFQIRNSSIYLIIKVSNGIVLVWDKKTSIIIKVTPGFQNMLCGLCGNYDGNSINDFNTRGHFQVADVIEFGNSWKLYPTCPEITSVPEPCEINPFRKTWAQRTCNIILSDTFQPCHSQVDPYSYYDACVKDSCGCNEGGDCACFCTAVAMYAQACLAKCVCIEWRNPNLCPVFCDYYNKEGNCEWHYRACGPTCMKTCQNPSGICTTDLFKVEGCYPSCPPNKPFFEEIGMTCEAVCGCYDQMGKYYKPGEIVISCNNCESCQCAMGTIDCKYDLYVSTTTTCKPEVCIWSDWIDISTPTSDIYGGDYEILEAIRLKGYKICDVPRDIQCQAVEFPSTPAEMGQKAICNASVGLICHNEKQIYGQCFDYKIKVLCCQPSTCKASTIVPTTTTVLASSQSSSARTSITASVTSKHASTVTLHTLSTSIKSTTGTAITKCACTSDGKLYPPDCIIYTMTDENGCVTLVKCSHTCEIINEKLPCNRTTTTAVSTISTISKATSMPSVTPTSPKGMVD